MSHKYTQKQAEFIKENVKGIGNTELTKMLNSYFKLNLKVSQIVSFKHNHKLNSGLNGQFNKGHVPSNKGKKGIYAKGAEKTWFKKGHRPMNHRTLGSERINAYGYTEVKVAEPNKWRLKHQVIWENKNGPIPEGHAVIFGDGDPNNLDFNNLILVSRQQLLILNRNNLIQKDADLTRTAVIIADIYQKISKRKLRRNDIN